MKKYLENKLNDVKFRVVYYWYCLKAAWAKAKQDYAAQTTIWGRLLAWERGAVDIGGIMMLGIGMVFLSIGFIFLPITTDAAETLLAYAYTDNANITDATFTGYTSVVGVTPILILVGFLTAAVITGMMGIRIMKGSEGSTSFDPGSLMLVGLSIVFIGIGLIIEPVMLDGAASLLHNGGAGISSSFTGYESIVEVSPLIVHIGFLAASVLSGFFGIKKLGGEA